MNRGNAWYWFVVWFTRRVFFGLLGGTTVLGLENIPATGAVLLAPVHVSYLDPMLVGCTSTRALSFMAKEELFKPPLGWILRSLGSFPVKRGGADKGAISHAIQELEKGNALMMFPEGTRGDGVHLSEIQSGVLLLAKKSGAQVVPVGISGTHGMWPKGRSKIKRGHSTIVYGVPFTFEEIESVHGKAAKDVFTKRLEDELIRYSLEAGLRLEPRTALKSADQK